KIEARAIEIASNRVRVELACEPFGASARIAFDEQSGWLLAGIADPGFIDALDDGARATFENALAGFYKMADVDLVREQIEACILQAFEMDAAAAAPPYDIADEGLVVWPDDSYKTEIVYPLTEDPALAPQTRDGAPKGSGPRAIDRARLFFRDEAIS